MHENAKGPDHSGIQRGIRERLSFANVMATIAVFGVLASGGAYAAQKIGPNDIKKNAVRAKHIKKNQVKSPKLAPRSVKTGKLADGAVRPRKLSTETNWAPIPGSAFVPLDSATAYQTFSGGHRYCTDGPPFFEAALDGIPHGARLTRLDVRVLDESALENLELSLVRTRFSDTDPALTILGLATSSGIDGWGETSIVLPGEGELIDNEDSAYVARARLDGTVAGDCSEGADLRISTVVASWHR